MKGIYTNLLPNYIHNATALDILVIVFHCNTLLIII